MANEEFVAIREDIFTQPITPLADVRLVGSKCNNCNEVMFGIAGCCSNCATEDLSPIPLSTRGTLWTYTVIRSRPPGAYLGPSDPFIPFAEGLVELPEGIRVLSVLDCDIDAVNIGMPLELVVYPISKDDEGREIIGFKFKAI